VRGSARLLAYEDYMMELARKKSAKKSGGHHILRQYVMGPTAGRGNVYITSILRQYPKVIVLDKLDDSTALVEMSDIEHERISREHPELLIEPNLLYKLVG
jgi:hypothetical protein